MARWRVTFSAVARVPDLRATSAAWQVGKSESCNVYVNVCVYTRIRVYRERAERDARLLRRYAVTF